jgi:CRISPR-associated protein Csb2
MFAIAWQYLSGRATAKEIDDQQKAEWPPHPDRVFQALVAAWGERDCAANERDALEWLEQQTPPQLAAPEDSDVSTSVTPVFVPVNDIGGSARREYAGKELGLLPERRPRKERTFATVHVGDAICALIWSDANPSPADRSALETLCRAVTHVGHSRSLVRMWVAETPPDAVWEPAPPMYRFGSDLKLRIPHKGRLIRLEQAHKDFVEGRLARNAWPTSQWQDYVRCRSRTELPHSAFGSRLIAFRRVGGDGMPGLLQGPVFVRVMRATLIQAADGNARAMPWISGHEAVGTPLQRPHVAVLPLAHVGHEHADGHLLGMAIALPRDMAPEDEQSVHEVIAKAADPETGEIGLKAGPLGAMLLAEDGRTERTRPMALRSCTWTGPARLWGTVTPIALDRLPPRRHEDDEAWVAGEIAVACERQGLPPLSDISVLPVSAHAGAPACRAFPPLLRKPDGANRWHVHAVLRFAQPFEGPLVLGAGRYRGYGLCKPLASDAASGGQSSSAGGALPADSLPLADTGPERLGERERVSPNTTSKGRP